LKRAAASADTQDDDQRDAQRRDRCQCQHAGPVVDAGMQGVRYSDAAEADGGEGGTDGEPGNEIAIGSPRRGGVRGDRIGGAAVEGQVCEQGS